MAMDLGGGKGGLNATINVTPLVDVMLVLLIIMMLVAPMLNNGVEVKLPPANNVVDKPETQGQTVIAIAANKSVYVNAQPVKTEELGQKVSDLLQNKKEKIVMIKADEAVDYSVIMATMDELRKADVEDVALITDHKRALGGGN